MGQEPGVREHKRRPKRVAQGARTGPFEHRIGEQEEVPAAPHPIVERDEIFRGLGGRVRQQQQPPFGEIRRARDADRHDAISRLERGKRRGTASLERELLAEHERQAGQEEQGRSLARWPWLYAAMLAPKYGNRDCGPDRQCQDDCQGADPRPVHRLLLLLLAVFELTPPGATPNSASGSLASLALALAAFTLLSWLERMTIEPSRTIRKAKAS